MRISRNADRFTELTGRSPFSLPHFPRAAIPVGATCPVHPRTLKSERARAYAHVSDRWSTGPICVHPGTLEVLSKSVTREAATAFQLELRGSHAQVTEVPVLDAPAKCPLAREVNGQSIRAKAVSRLRARHRRNGMFEVGVGVGVDRSGAVRPRAFSERRNAVQNAPPRSRLRTRAPLARGLLGTATRPG
jgi:hypothetical protein